METYQNAQICYERRNKSEDSVKRVHGSLLVHYILEEFWEDFWEVFQSEIQIWKICISKPRPEKSAYPKTFKWLQKEKMSERLDIFTFIEHKNRYLKFIDLSLKEWKMWTMWYKKLQKQDKLVRWDKKWNIHIKFEVFKFKEIRERLESFSENCYILL